MPRGRIFDDITQTIGETPLIRLKRLSAGLPGHVVVKHEGFNPFNSVKDRIGVAMLSDAIARGAVKPGMIVVEPTSGNTGIGLAFAAAVHGLRLIIVMPDSMTVERRNLLRALGATVLLTEGAKGMKGAIARAEDVVKKLGGRGWMPQQFANPANPAVHYRTTGPEIWTDTDGTVDVLVSGVGTGGTLTGTGKYLREKKPELRIVAVEPVESAVLSGGAPSPHKQQGIGAGFVPEVLDTSMYDEVVQVRNEDAIETTRRMAREEGIFAGISSGSVAWAALQVAARPDNIGRLIVAVLPDFGERYLSNPVYADLPAEPLPAEVAAALGESPRADVAASI